MLKKAKRKKINICKKMKKKYVKEKLHKFVCVKTQEKKKLLRA